MGRGDEYGPINFSQNMSSPNNAPDASDDFGGAPRAEVVCADARQGAQQTNNKQTLVARHDDCAGVMNNDLIRLSGRPRVKPLDRPNLRPKETKHNG